MRKIFFALSLVLLAACSQQTADRIYEVAIDNNNFLEGHTVFYPEDLTSFPKQDKLPVVVMSGPGCVPSSTPFKNFFTEVASHGYLMIVDGVLSEPRPAAPAEGEAAQVPSDTTVRQMPMMRQTTKEDMIAGVDWAFEANEDPESIFYGKIDTDNVCLMGQSCGGIQVLDNMGDPRVTLMALFNSGLFKAQEGFDQLARPEKEGILAQLTVPIAYFLGGTDMARPNGTDDFNYINTVPVIVAVRDIPGDAHAGTFREEKGGAFGVAAVRWLDWNTKGNKDASKYFVGENSEMAQDSLWIEIMKKNME